MTEKPWIALLRGVNVGGNNKLPMKQLATKLAASGLVNVTTYLQSGNVVFRCPDEQDSNPSALATLIGSTIKAAFGFEPWVMVIDGADLAAAVRLNPFPEAATEADGKNLHFYFLATPPVALDAARLEAIRLPSERWQVKDAVFYLHTPDGFNHSKLAARAEKILGVPATARNARTVRALLALVEQ